MIPFFELGLTFNKDGGRFAGDWQFFSCVAEGFSD
jgi:hypothetical protein